MRHTLLDGDGRMLKCLFHFKAVVEFLPHCDHETSELTDHDLSFIRSGWGYLGCSIWRKEGLGETLFPFTTMWKEVVVRQGSASSPMQLVTGQGENGLKLCQGGWGWISENFCIERMLKPSSLQVFQKMRGHDTAQWGLVGVVVFNQRLDLMTLEDLSNLNDSMITTLASSSGQNFITVCKSTKNIKSPFPLCHPGVFFILTFFSENSLFHKVLQKLLFLPKESCVAWQL